MWLAESRDEEKDLAKDSDQDGVTTCRSLNFQRPTIQVHKEPADDGIEGLYKMDDG